MPAPRISIVIPFFDETAYLSLAVNSVFAQGIDAPEVIVVNDNPDRFGPDDFAAMGLPASVRLLHHPENRGLSAARNTGIAAARAPVIGFLDADDYYVADGLAAQLACAEASGADLTHAQCLLRPAGGTQPSVLPRDAHLFGRARSGPGLAAVEEAQFITSSWSSLYRADFLADSGLSFDEEQVKFEDRLFVLESVTAAGSIAVLGAPVRVWRRRAGSISTSPPDAFILRLQVQLLEKCMARMRALEAAGQLPPRFLKRETFNTVSRLIWDMALAETLAARPDDAEIAALAARVPALLGDDSFGHQIFDDPVLRHISRVGIRTRHGVVSRSQFFECHRLLREGRLVEMAERLARNRAGRAAPVPAEPRHRLRAGLVLHVGAHKTGTTFLQANLQARREPLLSAGVLVPQTGQGKAGMVPVRADGFCGHQDLLEAARSGDEAMRRALMDEVERSGARQVVISCENMLQQLADDRPDRIAALMGFLDGFAERRVVAMLRRPDIWLDRFYRESVCNGQRLGAADIAEFVVDHAAAFTDLPGVFAPFEAATGRPVALADFDAATGEGALWPAFLRLAGIATAAPALDDAPRYPSPGRGLVQAAELANRLIDDPVLRRRTLHSLFRHAPDEPADQPLLPPAARRALLDRFAVQSADWAAERGYAPDIAGWHAALDAEDWVPAPAPSAALLRRLGEARAMAEAAEAARTPAPAISIETARTEARPTGGALVIRVRPRPWLVRLVTALRGMQLRPALRR